MNPDYSNKYYKSISFSRKRQVINAMLEDLHNAYFDMIEQALEVSDFRESQEIINYIKELQ